MKTLHKLMAVGVAMACVGLASAQTTIRITGSSAFRKATHLAIMHVLGGTDTTLPAGGKYGYNGGTLSGANAATFYGSLGGNAVIIKTSWSGSVAGIQTVAGSLTSVKWLPASVDASLAQAGTPNLADPTASGQTAGNYETGAGTTPDIAMSDVYQASTVFNGTFAAVNYAQLTDTVVGVVPFKWVVSAAAPVTFTNMTPQLAQANWVGTGKLPLALYTGDSNDQGTFVYATGRDPDSGTRLTAFAESGVGVNSTVRQYDISQSGTTPTLYAQQVVNGITFPIGQGGQASGGTLAGTSYMKSATAASKIFVTYLGLSDAVTATVTAGGNLARELTYNGVAYSDAAVREGKYTFWGYEHLMYRGSLAGTKLTFATSLASQIINTDAPQSGIALGTMSVVRATDGGVVTADY